MKCAFGPFNYKIALQLSIHADGLSLFIRAGNHWWVSDQLGKKGGYMRAEVGEENMRLPPVKGWEVYTPGKSMSCKSFRRLQKASEDLTLECSRHPTGQFVRQNDVISIL